MGNASLDDPVQHDQEDSDLTSEFTMRIGRHVEALVQDVRFSVRVLLRERAFTVTVLVTLAIGIGLTSAVFTLVDVLLLRPLPVTSPEISSTSPLQEETSTSIPRTTHTSSTSGCGPRVRCSATFWHPRPLFHPASTCPTVPSRTAFGANWYRGTTSTSSALARRLGGA